MRVTRRELGLLLPALAAGPARTQEANKVLPSKAWKFEDLPVRTNGQNRSRDVFKGQTHTGFPVDLHLTELAPGLAPHPPHKHVHEEILMLQAGTLDVTIEGTTTRIGPGSVVYVHSNEMHGWKNTGTNPAQYFVMALGNAGGA
jgi:quercetin dioxygenase-like cupin family protein